MSAAGQDDRDPIVGQADGERVGADAGAAEAALRDLLALMARLRDPERGCAWDRKQTFASIAPYTLEEAYELWAAIDAGEPQAIADELGDLLFQVVFHARIAEEHGHFAFVHVARGIHAKLVRRHPHVFGPEAGAGDAGADAWEAIKARERASAAPGHPPGVLAGIPASLPALSRAAKLGRRAGRVGFDWPDVAGVRAKLIEELEECDVAAADAAALPHDPARQSALAEELGDLLFACANYARRLGTDPEEALRHANAKFERRFAAMEAAAALRGLRGEELRALTLTEWEALWAQAKAAERA